MTPGRPDTEAWRRANDVFHRALDMDSTQRAAFVRGECADNPAIGDDVLSLLAAHDRTEQFLAQPAATPQDLREIARDDTRRRLGQHVGQYRIDSILGEGGMGVVYRAADTRLGRTVALKAISADVTRDPARRERLRREARAVAALTHPGIATVYALEEFGDDIFIAGEFVAGETLRDEGARGPGDAARVLDTAIELAQALAAAHDRGVIHRDLKPENVMRSTSGHVKILDFGLARLRDVPPELANLTEDGKVFGTPAYMSPEQIRREPADGRSDLFSLGILLYELLTGIHPFASSDASATIARILESEPPPFAGGASGNRTGDNLRRGLESVIRVLLRKVPDARFGSAHELAAALARVRAGEVSYSSGELAFASHALWWWKFHQAATSVFYALLLIPTWLARYWLHNQFGLIVFLIGVVAVVATTTLRMHLWFAADSMPGEWAHQHARTWKWLRAADLLFVAALITAAVAILEAHSVVAVVLVISGVLALLSATIIEPATTRAAFGSKSRSGPAD